MKKVIKASAGTGKTYSLALEYIKELIIGIDFRKIYVMTFTKKATSEIRERVLLFLEEIVNKTAFGDEILENIKKNTSKISINFEKLKLIYRDILFNKDKIKIYTIDSFIKILFDRLVAEKRHIYTYNVDNDENKEIMEAVLAELISNKYYMEKVKTFLLKERRRNLEEYELLIDQLVKNRWKFEFIGNSRVERKKYNDIDLEYETSRILNLSDDVIKLTELEREEILKEPFLTYNSLDNSEKDKYVQKKIRDFFKVSSDIIWNGNKTRGNKYKTEIENFRVEYQDYKKNLAKHIFNEEIVEYEKNYFEISDIIFKIYDRIRFSEKSFNNMDRTIYTYKLLFENEKYIKNGKVTEDFYELFGNDIETIFIDEFQDTSVLQWSILKAVVENSNNAVIVGDAKQSIYGWRDGEKRLFENLEKIITGDVRVNSLSKTYRTKENVMTFLNDFFGNISETWNYESIDFNSNDGFIELKVYNNDNIEEDTKDKIISEIITSLKESDTYQNTAVIARSNKELSNISSYLESNKIPFILESNNTLKEYEGTEALFQFFHFLVFNDFISLIKFLRSDFININADDLKYVLENKYKIQKYIEEYPEDISVLREFFDKIVELNKLAYIDKINYIFENFNILKEDKSNIVYKNILYLYKLLLKFESLEDFLEKIEKNKELIAIQGITETNAVILTTIHKSKGLEYNTVYYIIDSTPKKGNNTATLDFLVDLTMDFTKIDNYIIFNSRNRNILELLDNYKELLKKDEHKKDDENINNLYVALTRAKSNLYIYYYTGKKGFRDSLLEKSLSKASNMEIEEILNSVYTNGVQLDETVVASELKKININIKNYFIDTKKYDKIKKTKKSLLMENSRKEGLAIHYYFENIKYADDTELFFAKAQVFQKYGNMLGKEKLEEVFQRADNFIFKNKMLFSRNWEVFNEYEIKDEHTNEIYRIDKLLLDKNSKEVMILDFKSGQIHDENQILNYGKILMNKLTDYKIITKFIKL